MITPPPLGWDVVLQSDRPGLCLFCCYQPCVLSANRVDFGFFLFHKFFNVTPRQRIWFVISTFSSIFFIEISFVLPPPPAQVVKSRGYNADGQLGTGSKGSTTDSTYTVSTAVLGSEVPVRFSTHSGCNFLLTGLWGFYTLRLQLPSDWFVGFPLSLCIYLFP